MPYAVRYGKLYFEPATGNGPCARRHAGTEYRRHLPVPGRADVTCHATKGRFYDRASRLGTEVALHLPSAPNEPPERNLARIKRNDASHWAAVCVEAPEVMSRQRRRAMERRGG